MLTAGLILSACGDSTTASYKVSLTNLTYSQPMSPMAITYHEKGENIFSVGQPVSIGLETLAEAGNNAQLLSELQANTKVVSAVGGNGLVLPSKTDTVIISGRSSSCLSLVSMLVNTNDAFVGMNCIDVSTLAVGSKLVVRVPAYDAGTEANSELASTVPGPVGGGEGFNATRDDVNFVYVHSNVVTKDDGLSSSALTQAHKWDNPTATITVERI